MKWKGKATAVDSYHQPEDPFARMRPLFSQEAMARLASARVTLLGIGGVGGHCAEALARCGVGAFRLVDGDRVAVSNLNRQAVALHSTLGQWKAAVMRERILDITPAARVETVTEYYRPDAEWGVFDDPPDLVVDAIDQVTAKVALAARAQALTVPIISCMGAGNKRDPQSFEAADLYDTTVCPLCRAVRKLAREAGIERLRVVYSKEAPASTGMRVPASVAYVTASAGLLLAAEAVRMIIEG